MWQVHVEPLSETFEQATTLPPSNSSIAWLCTRELVGRRVSAVLPAWEAPREVLPTPLTVQEILCLEVFLFCFFARLFVFQDWT